MVFGIVRRAALIAGLGVGLATLPALPAFAQGPIQLSSTPIAESPAWKSYVLGDGASQTSPVRISSTSGAVTNAQGLVDPSKGPARLTWDGTGLAPLILLDYGREVGGLPFFDVGAVNPASGATSVTLRSAYSEAREFLWTYGNATLSVPAAAGDTNIKVGGVANFVVGGTLQVDDETATIAAIGTQSRSTTLFSPASAGDTNVKVASTTGIAVGDGMRIDTGGTTESVTVTNVGTQGRNTTLAAAAAAGATNIKVASVTGMSAGDTIHVDTGAARETRTIASVGTSGANGTGVTLTNALSAAHAAGVAVQDPGTGITFTPALTSAHDAGAGVLALGTGITLTAPLGQAHPAGAPVRGITGTLTGDRNGFNGVGVAPSRAENFTLTGPGTVGNAPNAIQGGQRFQAITLTTPGTVELTGVGIHVRYPNASSDDYAGHFLSSDERLNRIWYQGAYTNDTDMVPIGAVPSQTIPVILDGAKRDRRPWIGDLLVQGRTAFNSLGFGAKGSDYIKGPIRLFGASQAANGSVFGHIQNWTTIPPGGGFYSLSYSMYFVLDLASYYLYSGDAEFVKSQYQIMKNELAYNRALVDPTSGLLISGAGERDWDFYDGGKPGAVTAYNAIYYKALADAARLAGDLAERYSDDPAAATWRADAATWSSQAADLKSRINATLFDTARGVYKLADRDNANHAGSSVPQDGNSNAINFGIAPASAHAAILDYLRDNLWGTFGPQPYSPDANYSTVISPFVTGMEVDARFAAGDTDGALDLIHLMWDQMTDESGPYYTATLWEKLNQDGTDVDANASLSHGWASGPVSSLSGYLLGARPVTAGYQTWILEPHPGGDVEWAQGRIPTPSGPIVSRWRRGDGNRSFTLTMAAPEGTSGTVVVPLLGRSLPIAMDGKVVWPKNGNASGLTAVERDGAVHFSGITGSHTFAWGNADHGD
jgi:alpha-L-rhamnosidase